MKRLEAITDFCPMTQYHSPTDLSCCFTNSLTHFLPYSSMMLVFPMFKLCLCEWSHCFFYWPAKYYGPPLSLSLRFMWGPAAEMATRVYLTLIGATLQLYGQPLTHFPGEQCHNCILTEWMLRPNLSLQRCSVPPSYRGDNLYRNGSSS